MVTAANLDPRVLTSASTSTPEYGAGRMTVAVVTGAGSGMGRASVDALRGLADVLVAVDLREPDIEGTVGVACDVADPAAVRALADRVRELGPLRALVHAAGISPTM